MPTLFRRIRERLLKESRFTRYLVYATGEIVLVVAGILIALQINNWNEGRKQSAQQVNLMNALIFDLKEKMEENIDDLAFGEAMMVKAEKAINDLGNGGQVDTAHVKDLLRYMAMDTWFYNTFTPTYNSVVNSSLWQQLPDTVARAVQGIYDQRSTRVSFGFEKATAYATDCRINYLAPHDLIDLSQDPTVLSNRIAQDHPTFRSRLTLFMDAVKRQNRYFAGSRDAIQKALPGLVEYRDELASADQ